MDPSDLKTQVILCKQREINQYTYEKLLAEANVEFQTNLNNFCRKNLLFLYC